MVHHGHSPWRTPEGDFEGVSLRNHPSPTRGRHSIGPALHAAPSTNHHHNLMPTLAPFFVAIRRVANCRPSCRVHCLATLYAPSAIRPLRCAPLPSLGPASSAPSLAPTSLDVAASPRSPRARSARTRFRTFPIALPHCWRALCCRRMRSRDQQQRDRQSSSRARPVRVGLRTCPCTESTFTIGIRMGEWRRHSLTPCRFRHVRPVRWRTGQARTAKVRRTNSSTGTRTSYTAYTNARHSLASFSFSYGFFGFLKLFYRLCATAVADYIEPYRICWNQPCTISLIDTKPCS